MSAAEERKLGSAVEEISRLVKCENQTWGWQWRALLLDRQVATQQDVKRQYRRLALIVHPDKAGDEAAEDATQAFKVLSLALEAAYPEALQEGEHRAPGGGGAPSCSSSASQGGAGRHPHAPAAHQTYTHPNARDPNRAFKTKNRNRSYPEMMDDLRAFEEAFMEELKVGREEAERRRAARAEEKREREERQAEQRRTLREQWLEGEDVIQTLDSHQSAWASFKNTGKKRKMPPAVPKSSVRDRKPTHSKKPIRHSVYGLNSEHEVWNKQGHP